MRRRLAAGLLFCLSAAVLILEILAARLLAPYVGLSLETYTAIIGVVLAGIAAGHAVGGLLADQAPWRPGLGGCLLIGGLGSSLIVPIVRVLGGALRTPSIPAVVLLAFAGFFLPTAALSAASPIVTRAQIESLATSGRVVGSMSAWSTAGALTGTFLTGFVLVSTLPTTRIIYLLSAGLLGLGVWFSVPRRGVAGAVAFLVATAGVAVAADAASPCERETRYYCVRIVDRTGRQPGRILRLDTLSHSFVDLDDPTRLGFRYQRVVAAVIASQEAKAPVRDVLHVGGGGYAFPRYLDATRPQVRNRVFELDPELLDVATDRLGLPADAVDVAAGDARTALTAERPASFDVIVADTFGSLDPPWHLATVESARAVKRLLRPSGVYALNIVDTGPLRFARAETATLSAVFRHVAVVTKPSSNDERPANNVLVASDEVLDLSIDPADGLVLEGKVAEDFGRGADVLTDDFAPVQRLLTRSR